VLIDAKATLGELQAGQEHASQEEEHLDANRLPKRTRTGAARIDRVQASEDVVLRGEPGATAMCG